MQYMPIKFRNFKECFLEFSYYENGNICTKLFSEGNLLSEITLQGKEKVEESLLLKDIACNEEIIGILMWNDIILGTFPKSREDGSKFYYCPLNMKIFEEYSGKGYKRFHSKSV